jgi:hypothetical protein
VIHKPAIGRDVVVRYAGQVVAVGREDSVLLMPSIAALERDHPRRRFIAAVALVGHEMAAEPFAEVYDDELAQFYARILLMPNDEFETLHGTMCDAEIAEHFNVPLEQVSAKRQDVQVGL